MSRWSEITRISVREHHLRVNVTFLDYSQDFGSNSPQAKIRVKRFCCTNILVSVCTLQEINIVGVAPFA